VLSVSYLELLEGGGGEVSALRPMWYDVGLTGTYRSLVGRRGRHI
jgi:hypothetical protein